MLKQYDTFIATGCSFTSGVINARENLLVDWEMQAFSWPHYTFLGLGPENKTFLNFAIPGGGNTQAMTNLIYFLEKNKNVNRNKLLVGFNITGLNRVDRITSINDPIRNTDLSTRDISDKLNIGWRTGESNSIIKNNKNVEIRNEFDIFNCLIIIQAINYLENNNIDYFFMIMNNAIVDDSPEWFKKFLLLRKNNWVIFETYIGMYEFCRSKKLLDNTNHPTRIGHQLLADYVLKFLNDKT